MARVQSIFVVFIVVFSLLGAAGADWSPGDPFKMHFPQMPDEAGWDVNSTQPLIVADDWRCTETGWVKDIHSGVHGEME